MNKKLRLALVASIRKHTLPPFTEATLVKLLTDVRKLMEELSQLETYSKLKVFCDWVVHPKLSGPKVQKALSEMDELYDSRLLHNIPIENDMPSFLGEFLTFQGFKNELSIFLNRTCGVVTPNVLDKNQWEEFEHVYCNIVGDCQLVYESKSKKKPLKPLKHIDSAVVSIRKPQFSPAQIRYDPLSVPNGVEWVFFKDGKEAFRMFLTWGSKPALRDGLLPQNKPQTPTRPPG
jgi:hypothetical protein